jgi:acetoin utilization protein AcuC
VFTLKKITLIHDEIYSKWVFSQNHPTQGRRFQNAHDLLINDPELSIDVIKPIDIDAETLLLAHSETYIDEVVNKGISGEWDGANSSLGALAKLFVGGTLTALDQLLSGKTQLAAHLPGAKHHAQYDHSSGFCVFADFAIAAKIATQKSHRVAIFDLDAHHGDGTENLLRDEKVLTFSVHDSTIFPGTGFNDEPENLIYNEPLDSYTGDEELLVATKRFIEVCDSFKPTMLFIACGADAHESDPLSTLQYTVEGYKESMKTLKATFGNLPILVGGAGGYQPDTFTPLIWKEAVKSLSEEVSS